MPLVWLRCQGTKVIDLSPLKGMPLESIVCDVGVARDSEFLRSLPTLKNINEKPAAEFWKEVGATKP
jgi:hypothetical protein